MDDKLHWYAPEHSPDEDARDHAESRSDALRLAESDWVAWCCLDAPEDRLSARVWDLVASVREAEDRIYRIRDGDPELV